MEFVEQLKSSIDIVKVIGEYGVRLRRAGSSARYMGLCPFHQEKTPSFSVHSTYQFYKCFGCGVSGDVIKFVMEMNTLTFPEALRLLAERHGIPMPKREYADADTKLRAAIYKMHEMAAQVFATNLHGPGGAEARAYLAKRGVAPELIEVFGLGYTERTGQDLARRFEQEGFTPQEMEESGLVVKRTDGSGYYDRFRGRLMFPIHSETGKVIGFGGRALRPDDEPKYLNSAETRTSIYRKGHVLYNLHRAKEGIRKNDRSVLVEGYMDVIGVYAAGVKEVVATCGTALTVHQVRTLRRHAERIVVNFDADAAGVAAAERSIQMLLEEGMRIRVLELDGGLDPDEYVKQRGAEAYRERLDQAPGYFLWLADRSREKYDMRSAEGRVAAFQFLLPSIHRLTDKIERVAVANEVASHLGVDSGLVLEHFRKAAADRREKTVAPAPEPVSAVEKILLNSLLASEQVRKEVAPRLREAPAIEGFKTRRVFRALFGLMESGAPFGFSELHGRLAEEDQALIASVVFADEVDESSFLLEQALACLNKLEARQRETERAALRAQLKEAERTGNLAEALRLAAELNRLARN